MAALSCRVPLEDISVRKGKPWRGGTQRGEKLAKYIISLFSFIEDTVLDLFAGTGTFGLAAAFMGRHVLMFEGDDRIYSRLLLPYRSIEL
ncbi:hypothetical protein GOP47_0023899 [Adiantum capillus-veneris]|uniref:DNA methylase N-4/N-6 domain-containing protein n=1 Tax=Adiantum capillus-veneris TaxID=13818 RepID=A0A9D4U6I9_ADICA|nr:hypothetical protein GOP47_0023899 [Adiantum capillus-veneris]